MAYEEHSRSPSPMADINSISHMGAPYLESRAGYDLYGWSPWGVQPAAVPTNFFGSAKPQKNTQRFHFIDQTPTPESINHTKKQKNTNTLERSIDQEKSRIAQQKQRDRRGKFIKNEVASRLEELEKQLQEKEFVCETLRNTLTQRDVELESLKQQFQKLINERASNGLLHYPAQFVQVPQSVCTTNRNYCLVPSPNPAAIHPNRKPFMEKIDYSKIQLRKTDQLDEEKREVQSSQQQWEERQRFQEFMAKMEENARWQALQFQQQNFPQAQPFYGGSPSNIYPETQYKIGNLPVGAFTTKVDLEQKRQTLSKIDNEVLSDQTPSPARILSDSDLADDNYSIDFWMNDDEVQILSPAPTPPTPSTSSSTPPTHQIRTSVSNTTPTSDISPRSQRLLGGPPSNIYTPPEKIGNLQVPAFTTKVDYSEVALRRTGSQE